MYGVSSRLHVLERVIGGQRPARREHMDPRHVFVPVLRMLNHRLPDRTVGDDRRVVPQTDPGNDGRHVHVHGSLQYFHRGTNVPVFATGGQ